MRLLLAASALALATAPSGGPPWPGRTEPLVSGADGYHTYRIPSVIKLGRVSLTWLDWSPAIALHPSSGPRPLGARVAQPDSTLARVARVGVTSVITYKPAP